MFLKKVLWGLCYVFLLTNLSAQNWFYGIGVDQYNNFRSLISRGAMSNMVIKSKQDIV